MEIPLIASAAFLGLAGVPHCTAMCAAPCAAAVGKGGWPANLGFHLARVLGYSAAGGVAAASVGALAGWSQVAPALRPLWVMLHAAALVFGVWLLVKARQPAWLYAMGRTPSSPSVAAGWQTVKGPARAAAAGGLWVAWPCGLLQSALLVAAMGSSAATGALAMGGFALASAPGLIVGPWVARHLLGGSSSAARERLAARAAGVMLVAFSGWALLHGVWHDVAAFCGLA
ncbi:MAG: sulfite exporter TauE/SafE family protein [Aquabacterium sp.]|uniref:sulfite exporter TauE/SafE family protein n=1 Tax=Aquabacterium sp. TaxID=1872578 RepID=UPI0027226011|nr:sulfite exporter TauE/SafE family protein [Aquabacterium sp.]MDO9002556.1 sulfite exporter TauE/SafE family protein [Aquabacterium sp.]